MKEEYLNSRVEVVQQERSLTFYQKCYVFVKRFVDIIGGLFGSIFTLPLALIVKIVYVLNGDYAPIFFKQERIGLKGQPFKLYKFRTMVVNADQVLFDMLKKNKKMAAEYKRYKKLKDDPRITKIGRFLRNTSLDEFPQFFNVLKGDMSLVGPRPYLYREKEDMGEYFDVIVQSKPGLTGYWQVNGRSNTDFGKRLVLDEYYFYHKGIVMDLKILFKTVIQVITKKDSM